MVHANDGDDHGGSGGSGRARRARRRRASVTGAGRREVAEACQAAVVVCGRGTARPPGCIRSTATRGCATGRRSLVRAASTYTPTAADVGHQLACRLTVTYPLPFLGHLATATSAAITIQPACPRLHRLHPRRPALSGCGTRPGCSRLQGAGSGAVSAVDAARPRRAPLHPAGRADVRLHAERGRDRDLHDRAGAPRASDPGSLHRAHPRRRRCTRVLARANLTRTGGAGANRLMLPARIGRLTLTPGQLRPARDPRRRRAHRQTAARQLPDRALNHTPERLAKAPPAAAQSTEPQEDRPRSPSYQLGLAAAASGPRKT